VLDFMDIGFWICNMQRDIRIMAVRRCCCWYSAPWWIAIVLGGALVTEWEMIQMIRPVHGLLINNVGDKPLSHPARTRTRSSKTSLASHWAREIATGYERRVQADPSFPIKSITEVLLAASTQLTAEIQNRGAANILPQMDFVVPAILTAIAGKYWSMWKTAPTQMASAVATYSTAITGEPRLYFTNLTVPTNAFQRTMLDGRTVPTLSQRIGSLIVPMLPLFRAGCVASAMGYGLVALAIQVRSWYWPSYQSLAVPVNVVHAALYTGAFMALVSNLRYQVLQGIVEPAVDRLLARVPVLRAMVIVAIRIGNGLLGSMLAIAGMKLLGLQRLK
jgi:Protein RETICULATA-related